MPSRPGSRPRLANAAETEPVRGCTYDEGRKSFLAHAVACCIFFTFITDIDLTGMT